ncbi:lipoprotein signal peptidase [Spirochaetia bacterium]|nr:lipoprotein signal peptidase [Spirochaetia bacterium]
MPEKNSLNLKTLFHGRGKYIAVTVVVLAVNIALDRIGKALALRFLFGREPVYLLNNLVILLYAENDGAFLSLGSLWPVWIKYIIFIGLPAAVCIAITVYGMFRETKMSRLIALSCVIGGGVGNLFDRLFNHFSVIDFLNFGIGGIRTGILNIADLSVTFGVIALIILEFWPQKRSSPK